MEAGVKGTSGQFSSALLICHTGLIKPDVPHPCSAPASVESARVNVLQLGGPVMVGGGATRTERCCAVNEPSV